VPLAGQWLLSAGHCLYDKDRKLIRERLRINFPPAPDGIWNGEGTAPAGTNWVAIPHPTRDLVLIHAWPLDKQTVHPPKLERDPFLSTNEMLPGEKLDSVLGFGCTGLLPTPNDPVSVAFEGVMKTSVAAHAQTAVNTGWSSFALTATPDPSGLMGGDSGGPAFGDRETFFYAFRQPVKQRWLEGIHFSTTTQENKYPATCQGWAGLHVKSSAMTTFTVPKDPALAAQFAPAPIEWLLAERTRLASVPPPPKITGGLTIPLRTPDAYPSVAWTDLDGDGLWDLYAWGAAGLTVAKNAENAALGAQKTLLATLPPALLDVPPVMGDLNGDKIGDWVVLSPTGLSVAYGQDLFGGAANALGVGGDVFAPFAGVLVDPFTPHDGGTPRQPRLSTARASAA
jgi:hypothetical protein